jgi:glycosyltransferase involved in cell wall biosynthesis
MKLSVVLATFNEEPNLANCLNSIKTLADEIVVVDGSSTDKTREVAKAYHARVIQVSNDPMFHNLKQLAVDKSKGDWILQLDADEVVSGSLASEISQTINNQNSDYQGYYLPRINWFLGRFLTKGGQYPDYLIRLFKQGKGHFPRKSVHEQISIDGAVGYLKNDLIHNADPSVSKYLLRFNRYTSLEAEQLIANSYQPSIVLSCNYLIFKPTYWFFLTYFRHRGYIDGYQGFLFSLFSSLRFIIIYIKFYQKVKLSREKIRIPESTKLST